MKDERYCYNSSHMSSRIVTVDAVSSVEAAADIIIQLKVGICLLSTGVILMNKMNGN